MTDSDTRETWKPIPGFPHYQASDLGRIRSVDRVIAGKRFRSRVLKPRASNRGYLLVNLTDDAGVKQTRTVHTLVMLAFEGPCPPGLETRHLNGKPPDNRLVNLARGTKLENAQDQYRHGRNRPPPKVCPRCSAEHKDPGRRCHPCVVEIGEQGAPLLAAGVPLDEACKALAYPSETGLLTLARKYGGLVLTIQSGHGAQPSPSVAELPAQQRWSQRVTAARRRLTAWGDTA